MRLVALVVLLLAGCGGGATPAPEPAGDPQLNRSARVARLAFDQRQLDQAAGLTRETLDKAYARDDLTAIGDAGYNLAVIELRRGRPAEAARIAQDVQAELVRRGQTPFDALRLVEAMARYRSGDAAGAGTLAGALASSPQAEIVARAQFLRGLIAADAGDAAGVGAVIAALGAAATPELRADREELIGRLARLNGDLAGARRAYVASADLRRDTLDYAGVARVLALAADAARAAGQDADAADLYLRAGRSAAIQGNAEEARKWLTEAARLGTPEIAADANGRLSVLPK